MEKGTVKFFDSRDNKRFGFIRLESGEEIFFHANDGRKTEAKGIEVKFIDEPISGLPKVGNELVFERTVGGDGRPKASPWCWAGVYDFHASLAKIHDDQRDPLDRYPWLGKMFHFTSLELAIEDKVRNRSSHVFRDGVKHLKVFSVSATPETLPEKIREAMQQHQLAECAVLDKDGKEIEHCHFEARDGDVLVSLRPEYNTEIKEATGFHFSEAQQNLDVGAAYLIHEVGSDLKEATFFVLSNFAEQDTVVVYEITQ